MLPGTRKVRNMKIKWPFIKVSSVCCKIIGLLILSSSHKYRYNYYSLITCILGTIVKANKFRKSLIWDKAIYTQKQ